MKLGEYILRYREEHGLSQRQFAMKCGLSNGYIAMIEKGKNPKTQKPITPTLKRLRAIAKGMNMTLNELMRSTDGDTMVTLAEEDSDFDYLGEIIVVNPERQNQENDVENYEEDMREKIIDAISTAPASVLNPLYELIQALLADVQRFDEAVQHLNHPED